MIILFVSSDSKMLKQFVVRTIEFLIDFLSIHLQYNFISYNIIYDQFSYFK